MKKNYLNPTTKVVTVNVSAIMEPEFTATSDEKVPDDVSTEAPLF